MPEYPDLVVYLEALEARIAGRPVEDVRVRSPFVVRSADPPLRSAVGRRVLGLSRLGKRLVLGLEGELFLVLHLMVTGRLHWRARGAPISQKTVLLALDFPTGSLVFTEVGVKKRASLHLVSGREALAAFDRGGLEVIGSTLEAFDSALRRENHTLKRALADPRLLSGIGNAYSDEILHRARLSPLKQTRSLEAGEMSRLHRATVDTLREWAGRLRKEVGEGFPEKVTAFRPEMAVHGKYKAPCPSCGAPVQRIVYADNETNYCPVCQTEGRLLADRALSRLLKGDWPRSLAELDEVKAAHARTTPRAPRRAPGTRR